MYASYRVLLYLFFSVQPEPPENPVAAAATPPKIVPGGYKYSFIKEVPSHLTCIICKRPCRARDFCCSGCCGMTCCSSCLENAVSQKELCPYCKENELFISPWPVKFERRDQEVSGLDVYCINREKGCGWQGRLGSIDDHLAIGNTDGCQFHEFPCPCNCDKILQRRHMTAHVRNKCPNYEIDCQYCHFNAKRYFINGEHQNICPKFPLTCPNNCEIGTVFREDMENHREQCPLELVQCVYHNVGCTATMLRKDLEQHRNDNLMEHLKLELANTKTELGDTVNKITELESIIYKTNTALHVAITSSVLAWPDKLAAMGTICESNVLICPVILKMTQFTRKKQDEAEWFSASFFSQNQGYKMCLNVDANGYGDSRGTHMSIWLCLLKGPYDDELTWPLRERFEIQVLNQVNDKWHYALVVIYGDEIPVAYAGRITGNNRDNVVGEASFIPHQELCNSTSRCQFVKDDCVYFKVTKQ